MNRQHFLSTRKCNQFVCIIVSIILMLGTGGCRRWGLCKDEQQPLPKQAYTGNKLRLDGFYYGAPTIDYKGIVRYDILIPYADGVVLFPGNTELSEMQSYIAALADGKALRSVKTSWGTFKIQDTSITFGRWYVSTCSYPSSLITGRIVNDTTFVLTSTEIRSGGMNTIKATSDTYSFMHYTAKPDSTNSYLQ